MLTREEEMFLDEIERERNNKLADSAQLYWFLDVDDIRGLTFLDLDQELVDAEMKREAGQS